MRDGESPESGAERATGEGGSRLRDFVAPLRAAHPGKAGFFLQEDGINALASRLILAQQAEHTIDTQYYLITDDMVGLLFIGSLLEAADRGVKVRLLIDDILTQGYDAGMAALDAHPHFEVRIFNPWTSRRVRALNLASFRRLNRRMHNKSFTVDGQVTIIGGRNVANEYFGAARDVNFGDFDSLAVGPVVDDVSAMFAQYWDSEKSVPVSRVASRPADPEAELAQLRERIRDVSDDARHSRYGAAVLTDIEQYLAESGELFTWSDYTLAYDSPDKSDPARV